MNSVLAKVREKYPEYKDWSDSDLTLSLGAKYPETLDMPDFKEDYDKFSGLTVTKQVVGAVGKVGQAMDLAANAEKIPARDVKKGEWLKRQQAKVAEEGRKWENLTTALDWAGQVTEPYTGPGMLNQPARILGQPDSVQPGQPLIPLESTGRQIGQIADELLGRTLGIQSVTGQGVGSGAGQIAEGLTTPEMAVTAPALFAKTLSVPFEIARRGILGTFAGQMAVETPSAIQNAYDVAQSPTASPQERVAAGFAALSMPLMAGAAGKSTISPMPVVPPEIVRILPRTAEALTGTKAEPKPLQVLETKAPEPFETAFTKANIEPLPIATKPTVHPLLAASQAVREAATAVEASGAQPAANVAQALQQVRSAIQAARSAPEQAATGAMEAGKAAPERASAAMQERAKAALDAADEAVGIIEQSNQPSTRQAAVNALKTISVALETLSKVPIQQPQPSTTERTYAEKVQRKETQVAPTEPAPAPPPALVESPTPPVALVAPTKPGVKIPDWLKRERLSYLDAKAKADKWYSENPEPDRGPRTGTFQNPMTAQAEAAAKQRWASHEQWKAASDRVQSELQKADEWYKDQIKGKPKALIKALETIKPQPAPVTEPAKKGTQANAIETRKVEGGVQPERVGADAQRIPAETSPSDSVRPAEPLPRVETPGREGATGKEGEVSLTHKEFIATGRTEAEWDAYAAEQNRLSKERGQKKVVELWSGDGVSGNDIANLLRSRGVSIPESISKALQHDDTVVSSTSVIGRGMSRAEASKIHKWVSEKMATGEKPQVPLATEAVQYPLSTKEGKLVDKLGRPVKPSPGGHTLGIVPPGFHAAAAVINKLDNYRKSFGTMWSGRFVRRTMDQTFDAAENMANLAGNKAGNSLKIGTTKIEREAAMAIIESGGDPVELNRFLVQAANNEHARNVVQYAINNMARLQPLARRTKRFLDRQISDENAAGVDTEYRENYVPHLYNKDLWMGTKRPYVIAGSGGSGAGTGFRKGRSYATIFDAVEAGEPVKTFDVADLTDHRIRVGQRLLNRRAWGESLKSLTDPTDNRPIAVTPTMVTPPNRSAYEQVPNGYRVFQVTPGVRIGVHEGYSSLFDALTGNSRISGSTPGQMALKLEGGIKHGLLLFDTFHASRIMQKQLFLTGKVSYNKGKTLLEYSDFDLLRMVNRGELTQDMADWARTNRGDANLLIANGLNVGRIAENLNNEFIRTLPVVGTFNKWVFEKMTRGAMMESALIELNRIRTANPTMAPEAVAKQVSRDINAYFGNLGSQGVFKSKQMQDMARLVMLAPNWVESMARTELKGAYQGAKGLTYDPIVNKQLLQGTIGKGVVQGTAAYFLATQLLNYYSRGHSTMENQEGDHKLDAYIPDPTGKSDGFFISPFSVVAELTHDMIRYMNDDPNALHAAGRILSNKTSPLFRAAKALFPEALGRSYWEKEDGFTDRLKNAGIALAPTPIPLKAATQGGEPGQIMRQAAGSLGFKIEPARSRIERPQKKKKLPRKKR